MVRHGVVSFSETIVLACLLQRGGVEKTALIPERVEAAWEVEGGFLAESAGVEFGEVAGGGEDVCGPELVEAESVGELVGLTEEALDGGVFRGGKRGDLGLGDA